jgi:BCD family chlorophyll transporter-like MFS transporter
MAFGMQDVLLEPYGGMVLGMPVGATTSLTASLAFGGLAGFSIASYVLGRGVDPIRMSIAGVLVGVPAFALVIASSWIDSVPAFVTGVFAIGLGAGLFGHGTLTATMNSAPPSQAGLALGAWGAVQATCAGIAIALGGLLADALAVAARGTAFAGVDARATGFTSVYLVEIVLLLTTAALLTALLRGPRPRVSR